MHLFLDDYRNPGDVTWDADLPRGVDWHVVRNLYEFSDALFAHLHEIQHIAFDHDLADAHYTGTEDELTGYACAKLLVAHCMDRNLPLPNFSCHSMNPAGRANILAYLENYRRVCE
jgi:hypothetical protein